VLSHQDGHHSAVALLLKAALIQMSDYMLLGASGFIRCIDSCSVYVVKNLMRIAKVLIDT
jgi:hypothetical protein